MARFTNLQPWLEYFGMLRKCEEKGFLEVQPDKGEAYVTQSALFTVADGDNYEQLSMTIPATVRRIQAYAGWKSQKGVSFLGKPFALHVVKEEPPHDLLYSLILSRRRVWWKLWLGKADQIETITYY